MKKNSFYDKNLRAIRENSNHHIDYSNDKNEYKFYYENGNLCILKEGQKLKYNNLYLDESINNFKYNHNGLYFILGLTDIETIYSIYNRITVDSTVFIVEPNIEIYNEMIKNYDLSNLLSKKNVYLLVSDYDVIPSYFDKFLLKKGQIAKVSNLEFYTCFYYNYFERERALHLQKTFINYIKTAIFSLGNATDDTMVGLLQNLLNLEVFCDTLSIKELKNAYESKPVVIVSAGPSLENNINQLKNIDREKVLIFAVDTTLSKLINMDIIPDAVFSIERIEKVYEYFYKDVNIPKETVFVGPPVVKKKIVDKFKENRLIFPLRENDLISKWIKQMTEDRSDSISMGASCAHLAFGFARYIGCDPIIFIGQDLAYGDDGLSHSKGTVYDKAKTDKPLNENLVVEGYYDKPVKTSRTWKHFSNWFEQEFFKTNQLIINSTEGGVKLKHTLQMPLKQALEKYSLSSVTPLYKCVDEQFTSLLTNKDIIEKEIKKEITVLTEFNNKISEFILKIRSFQTNSLNTPEGIQKEINELIHMRREFEILLQNETAFLHFFTQTHELIAAYKYNKLDKNDAKEFVKKLSEILCEMFDISVKISETIINELNKFLRTSWGT